MDLYGLSLCVTSGGIELNYDFALCTSSLILQPHIKDFD